jgi:hypothetical protein
VPKGKGFDPPRGVIGLRHANIERWEDAQRFGDPGVRHNQSFLPNPNSLAIKVSQELHATCIPRPVATDVGFEFLDIARSPSGNGNSFRSTAIDGRDFLTEPVRRGAGFGKYAQCVLLIWETFTTPPAVPARDSREIALRSAADNRP